MNFDQFAKTLGPAAAPDTSNPLGASNAGVIGDYLKGAYLASASGRNTGAGTAQAQVQANNEQQAADYAKKLKIQELSDKASALKDQGDPKKFQKIGKDDGGFDFYDGAGNPITVQQYAQAQGQTPKQVLANSDNSLDQQYISHHKLTEQLVSALVNGDAKSRDKIFKSNPGLKEATHGLTGQQIIEQFQKAYPHIYGGSQPQTPIQSPAQDFGGSVPKPWYSNLGATAGGLYNGLVSTLTGG